MRQHERERVNRDINKDKKRKKILEQRLSQRYKDKERAKRDINKNTKRKKRLEKRH